MKIRIQYPSNQANPAVIEVDTNDYDLEPEQQLQHAVSALNVATKTVWGDKAQQFKAEDFTAWLKQDKTFADPDVDLDGHIKIVNGKVDVYDMSKQFISHNSSRAIGKAIKDALSERLPKDDDDKVIR